MGVGILDILDFYLWILWFGYVEEFTGAATQKNFSVIIYLQVGGVKFSAITGFKKLSIARLK